MPVRQKDKHMYITQMLKLHGKYETLIILTYHGKGKSIEPAKRSRKSFSE